MGSFAGRVAPAVATVLVLWLGAPAQAAERLSTANARAAARAVADLAGSVGARLELGSCRRFGDRRVDCALVARAGGCALVVSGRALPGPPGDVLIGLYGCPIAARPAPAQRSAARPADSARDFLELCPPGRGILFCPPGYGQRPDPAVAMLLPGAGLFDARADEPRTLTMSEARALGESVVYELSRGEDAPRVDLGRCTPLATSGIDCEIRGGDRLAVEPSCLVLRVTVRTDGWLAGDPYGCPPSPVPAPEQLAAGQQLVQMLVARRADRCLGEVVEIWPGVIRREPPADPGPCAATWRGDGPSFVERWRPRPPECQPRRRKCSVGPGGEFDDVRVCWRKRVRGRVRTVCERLSSA
jgi:hypothetical protein